MTAAVCYPPLDTRSQSDRLWVEMGDLRRALRAIVVAHDGEPGLTMREQYERLVLAIEASRGLVG